MDIRNFRNILENQVGVDFDTLSVADFAALDNAGVFDKHYVTETVCDAQG